MSVLLMTPRHQEAVRRAIIDPPYPDWDRYIALTYGWDVVRISEGRVFRWNSARTGGTVSFYSDFMRMVERFANFRLKMEMLVLRAEAKEARKNEPKVGIEHTRARWRKSSKAYRVRHGAGDKRGRPKGSKNRSASTATL